MLQNGTTAPTIVIDLTPIIVAIITVIATLGAVYFGSWLSEKRERKRELKRVSSIYLKIVFLIADEMQYNDEILEKKHKDLRKTY
jgi:hypothetical protein